MTGRASLSPLVLVAVVLAILIGVVGAVLVGGVSGPPPTPHAGEVVISLPSQVWGLLFLSPLIVGLLTLVLRRLFQSSVKYSNRTWLQLLVMAAVVLLFLFALSVLNPNSSGRVTVVGNGPPSPHANNSTNQSNTTTAQNASLPGSSASFSLPSWGLVAVVGAVSLCVAVVAIPGVLAFLHVPGEGAETREDVRVARRLGEQIPSGKEAQGTVLAVGGTGEEDNLGIDLA